jgi:16S rRNA G1207 methylase RsmC
MGRHKKNKSLQVKENEVKMTEQLELPTMKELETIETEIDKARLELEKTKKELEEQKLALKSLSSRDHDAKEVAIVEKQVTMSNENESAKAKIAAQKEYDSVMVKGRFMNRRAPGQMAKLAYIKYDTDPVKWYEFNDGGVYTIPRGFVDQINEHYYTPHFIKNEGIMDPENPESGIAAVDTSNKKYAFVAIGF